MEKERNAGREKREKEKVEENIGDGKRKEGKKRKRESISQPIFLYGALTVMEADGATLSREPENFQDVTSCPPTLHAAPSPSPRPLASWLPPHVHISRTC